MFMKSDWHALPSFGHNRFVLNVSVNSFYCGKEAASRFVLRAK